jgi:hypothetical protein
MAGSQPVNAQDLNRSVGMHHQDLVLQDLGLQGTLRALALKGLALARQNQDQKMAWIHRWQDSLARLR